MALAMDDGRVLWTTQTLAGDAYTIACADPSPAAQVACPASRGPDLDFGAAPVLVTRADGSRLLLAGQNRTPMRRSRRRRAGVADRSVTAASSVASNGARGRWRRAYVAIAEAWEKGPGEAGGISAVNLADGTLAWDVPPPQDSCTGRERCNTGQLAAVTALPGAVFSGSLDGHLRAYAAATGELLWDYDTVRSYDAVNGVATQGGSINGPGPAVAGGYVYVNSGYGMWNRWMPGNALLAFRLPASVTQGQ